MHMPKCCLGLFREPNWETYGQAVIRDRQEADSDDDNAYEQLHGEIRPK